MLTLSIDDSMTHDDEDVISENVDCIFILPEIIGPRGVCPERVSGVPDLPEARGKMCAAYDPSGAIIVCGGGPRLGPFVIESSLSYADIVIVIVIVFSLSMSLSCSGSGGPVTTAGSWSRQG